MKRFLPTICSVFVLLYLIAGCGSEKAQLSDNGRLSFTELEAVSSSDSEPFSDESDTDSVDEIPLEISVPEPVSVPAPSSSPTATPVPEPEGEPRYIVRVDMSAYLRKEANDSTADDNIITYIPVLKKVLQLRQEGDYSLVDYNGTQGYVKSEYLAATPFENTYWKWGRGVTIGSHYAMETYADGSFYAVSVNGEEINDYYQYDGENLVVDGEKYYAVDGGYESVEEVQAQSSFIHEKLIPTSKEVFESWLGTPSSSTPPATSNESYMRQPPEEYEVWTITKHNTGGFDEYREETYTLEWEPGMVHALLTKRDVSDERFFMLVDYDVDFDARTVDMCMDHFEGADGYTKLVIDLATRTCYGTDYYTSSTNTFS